jgi:hypothetical protein
MAVEYLKGLREEIERTLQNGRSDYPYIESRTLDLVKLLLKGPKKVASHLPYRAARILLQSDQTRLIATHLLVSYYEANYPPIVSRSEFPFRFLDVHSGLTMQDGQARETVFAFLDKQSDKLEAQRQASLERRSRILSPQND